jgi:hypothetical protein
VDLTKDGGTTTPKEPLHLGPGPIEDFYGLIDFRQEP